MDSETLLTPEIRKRVDYWLQGPFDQKTKEEVLSLQVRNPRGLIDAFYADLSFGTGGMRALMGVGTCRLNTYTIRLATQALANYLRKEGKKPELSVVVGFDSRHNSLEFAHETARVLAGNGIRVYLLDALRPTPYISFACRYKKADGAVMITASHNPKEYNGYKVYWSDGAQVVAPHDEGIVKEAEALKDLSQVKVASLDDPLIETIKTTGGLDAEYLKAIDPLQHFPEDTRKRGKELKIIYTSLHGTGITIVPDALRRWGFTTIQYVEEQVVPNGDFPTVAFPNPESKEALQMSIDLLERTKGDIAIANDPDADRIGIVAMHEGKPFLLSGNEMAAICVDYLCQVLTEQKKMPPQGAFVTTIVTTELLKTIAQKSKALCFEVLTGFKFIGEKIHQWETEKKGETFIFGAEESYGYLLGTHARDKDAIIASCLVAEIALFAKKKGQTLVDLLHALFHQFGIYREKQLSLSFKAGKEGMEQMAAIMHRLRQNPPKEVGGKRVILMEDYEKGIRTDLKTQKQEPLELPISDVLLFRLEDESRLVIRPSGTEPKVKIYGSASSRSFSNIASGIAECDSRLEQILLALKEICG